MSIRSGLGGFVASGLVLAACSQAPRGFDTIKNLEAVEVGEVRLSDLKHPPARVGEITWHRTEMRGQLIAAVHTQAPCPREIHTFAGAVPRKDAIELCFTGKLIEAPVPGFSCSTDVYVKYEFLGMPKDVEPKFTFIGDCFKK
jgi:hypothetical protein